MKTAIKEPQINLIQKGCQILEKKMGKADTLRFIMSFYQGSGDSVKYFNKFWKNKSISQIAQEIK